MCDSVGGRDSEIATVIGDDDCDGDGDGDRVSRRYSSYSDCDA